MDVTNSPGLYGKLPVLGDFITRRLPARFVDTWDAWLQSALAASRQQLGSGWLDVYLTSPIWRFILSPGICGPSVWAGVLMPSVDKVGRYFPLTLAVSINASQVLPPDLFVNDAGWFDRLEQLALSALEDDFELTEFDRQLQQQKLDMPSKIYESNCDKNRNTEKYGNFALHIEMQKQQQIAAAFGRVGACLLAEFLPAYSLWSTNGSEDMRPCLQVYENLPPQDAYSEFLVGRRQPGVDRVEAAASVASDNGACQASVDAAAQIETVAASHIQWYSCARSTVGKRRKLNEDAYLERPEIGLWAVADGMGGHSAGDVASNAAVDALGTLAASGNLETLTACAAECLHSVNADLLAMADGRGGDQIIGTTVVTMLAAGERCASIWAGDSRLYCYRDGELSQLTEDHSLVAEMSRQGVFEPGEFAESGAENIVTRALGAHPELLIDTITFEARVGDIYLLCSDGLIRELDNREIADILNDGGCDKSSQRLIDLALERGARDNVTVVVIHAGHG
jgi:type VI secretion system protein ImpM